MDTSNVQALRAIIGDSGRISTEKADLEAHSADESLHEGHEPEVVIWPVNATEISALLIFANQHGIPVTPRGGGSSLEGNPIPVKGGIVLAMSKMNQILEVRTEDLLVRVQPGVVFEQLEKRLGRLGLFLPPAPGSASVATIGGMVANNSSGVPFVKYGGIREYVLRLEVILPTGEIIHVGSDVAKSSSGYHLTHLFIGSEGTLGVITEITLQVRGIMERIASVAVFSSIKDGAAAASEMVFCGLRPAALELMDAELVRIANIFEGLTLPEEPRLIMEFHGTHEGVRHEAEYARRICENHDCRTFETGISPAEREGIWLGRQRSRESVVRANPEDAVLVGDVVVPISKYPEAFERAYALGSRYGIRVATICQAGDGHFHTAMFPKKGDADEMRRAELVNEEIVRWAISVGGTASGSHGIGIQKQKFMHLEHGASLELMRQIKHLVDPNGILNPGKIFEE